MKSPAALQRRSNAPPRRAAAPKHNIQDRHAGNRGQQGPYVGRGFRRREVSSSMCSDSSISPRPIATRPRSRILVRTLFLKTMTPIPSSTGASMETSKLKTCTIRVVPILAPSIIASAGTSPTSPSPRKVACHQRGCRAALQQRGGTDAGEKRGKPVAQCDGEHATEIGAESPQDAGLHHVQAPQQERDAADKV